MCVCTIISSQYLPLLCVISVCVYVCGQIPGFTRTYTHTHIHYTYMHIYIYIYIHNIITGCTARPRVTYMHVNIYACAVRIQRQHYHWSKQQLRRAHTRLFWQMQQVAPIHGRSASCVCECVNLCICIYATCGAILGVCVCVCEFVYMYVCNLWCQFLE